MTPATKIEILLVTCGITLAIAVGISALVVKVPPVRVPLIYSKPIWDHDHFTMQFVREYQEKGQASYLPIRVIHHSRVPKTVKKRVKDEE